MSHPATSIARVGLASNDSQKTTALSLPIIANPLQNQREDLP